jgi:hypothetical protein
MSMCSVYFDREGTMVVIGLDSERVQDDQEESLLLHRHYHRLLQQQQWREARGHVFIPENNLGLESAHLDTMVKDIRGVRTFWETDKRPGVCKTGAVTRGYQFMLANSLAQDACRFDRDCFTVTRGHTTDSMRALLEEQMLRYHWEAKPAPDAMGRDRYALTGKVGNKQDDLLIAFSMCLYWGRAAARQAASRL